MGKLDKIMGAMGGNIAESMGVGRAPVGPIPADPRAVPPPPSDRARGAMRSRSAMEVPLDRLERDPDQPREEFDEGALARLAESMKAKGQLQPIRVRWDESRGVYLIICGERRWRAARMAGMATMTAIVQEGTLDPGELLAVQLIENCLREDLRPVEQARAFRRLMEANGWTVSRVAEELHLSPAHVSKVLAMLDLPETVQAMVDAGQLAATTAYEIGKTESPKDQAELAARVVAEKLTRDEVRAAVKEKAGRATPAKRPRLEYTFNGIRIAISGEGITAGAEAIAAALRQVLEQVLAEAHGSDRDQAA